jgi:uncharacterized membrane protein YtjA (UPF0391 family)
MAGLVEMPADSVPETNVAHARSSSGVAGLKIWSPIRVSSTAQRIHQRLPHAVWVEEWQRPPPIVHLGERRTPTSKGAIAMLYTIAVILLIAWLLGFVGIYTIGSFVHVLLVVAIVLFLVGLLSGRRTLA